MIQHWFLRLLNARMHYFRIMFALLMGSCSNSGHAYHSTTWQDEITPGEKLLVVYASRAGSTIEVADTIAKHLSKKGYVVDVKHISQTETLDEYKALVIGSPIRMGKPVPEVMDFVKQNQNVLREKPAAVFILCMTLAEDTAENRNIVDAYLDPLRELINPIETGLFAGKMEYSKLRFFPRFAAKHMVKVPEGDFRNWKSISDWTHQLTEVLK
jgi:menaquinone-dependent protoporphyrinogen oxidase